MKDDILKKVISASSRCESEKVYFPYPKDVNNPLSTFLSAMEGRLDISIDLALTQSDYPEVYHLDFPGRSVIVVDSGYLGVINGLVAAFLRPMPISDPELEIRSKVGLLLRLFGIFIPSINFADHIKARIDENVAQFEKQQGIYMVFESSPGAIEMLPYDEYYVALWLFFIAHEAGHSIQEKGEEDRLVRDDLPDLIVSSLPTAQRHVDRVRAAIGDMQYRLFYENDLGELFVMENAEVFVDEIFCDQSAFLIIKEVLHVLRERKYSDFSNPAALADNVFLVFTAHQKLTEFRMIHERLGLFGEDGVARYKEQRRKSMVRFGYLRDLVACLVPCEGDPRFFKGSKGFGVFDYYGAMGIREIADSLKNIKIPEFDKLMSIALGVYFKDCFSGGNSD